MVKVATLARTARSKSSAATVVAKADRLAVTMTTQMSNSVLVNLDTFKKDFT